MAGASLLLWLGEQVTQKGVGNGISLVIFAGILLSLPNQVRLVYAQIHTGNVPWFNLVLLLAAFFATVMAVVYVTQGTRRIPIQHTKRVIGMRQTQTGTSYLPIKVNSAGVIPIIFAISLMLFPATLVNLLPGQAGEAGLLRSPENADVEPESGRRHGTRQPCTPCSSSCLPTSTRPSL